jgi:hypothetical protein
MAVVISYSLLRHPCTNPLRHVVAVSSAQGFKDEAIRSEAGTVHFPSTEDFLRCQVAGSPLASPVGQADDHARQALIQEITDAFRPFTSAEGVLFPIEGHVAKART